MSDPVTNAEVEDVLSSIRRLVSEDKRPVQAIKAEPRNDRLVLTPALRVSENVVPDEAPALAGDIPHQPAPPKTLFEEEFSEKPEVPDTYLESLVTDDDTLDVYDPDIIRRKGTADEAIDEVSLEAQRKETDEEDDLLFEDPAHDYSSDPYNFEDANDDDGEGDQTYLQNRSSVSDPDENSVDTGAQEMSQTAILMPRDDSFDEESALDQDDPKNAPAQTTPVNEVKAAALTAKITALETAIGQIAETWEPDDAGEGDNAGSEAQTMEWEDEPRETLIKKQAGSASSKQSPDAVQPEPEPTPQTSNDPDQSDEEPAAAGNPPAEDGLNYDAEEQLIDEDALRDLVSDIVRAELQGALGERITRNVRKLVRREIHRALAAQELE